MSLSAPCESISIIFILLQYPQGISPSPRYSTPGNDTKYFGMKCEFNTTSPGHTEDIKRGENNKQEGEGEALALPSTGIVLLLVDGHEEQIEKNDEEQQHRYQNQYDRDNVTDPLVLGEHFLLVEGSIPGPVQTQQHQLHGDNTVGNNQNHQHTQKLCANEMV